MLLRNLEDQQNITLMNPGLRKFIYHFRESKLHNFLEFFLMK